MSKIMVNIRIDKEMWNRIPDKNKSGFVRDVLYKYMDNKLFASDEVLALNSENVLLKKMVDGLESDKERLQSELDRVRPLYLPVKKWFQFWRR